MILGIGFLAGMIVGGLICLVAEVLTRKERPVANWGGYTSTVATTSGNRTWPDGQPVSTTPLQPEKPELPPFNLDPGLWTRAGEAFGIGHDPERKKLAHDD